MAEERTRPYVPAKQLNTDYPLIDSDPHLKRVMRYTRPSDWAAAGAFAAAGPGLMLLWERISPSYVGRGGFAPIMRLTGVIGLGGGFLLAYNRSAYRFYGVTENRREIEMDMREMVGKVKKGEPLYGEPSMNEYLQGVASRNSRYSAAFTHVLPWFNVVNHNQHGVDTAKYIRQAERELEEERSKSS